MLRSHELIELLISDGGLPGMSRRVLVEEAGVLRPGLQVLLMSGYASSGAKDGEHHGQGWPLIIKPFGSEQLARSVYKVLHRAESSSGRQADDAQRRDQS